MNLKEVMQEISDRSGAKAVFGQAHVKDGVTFIPVAKVSVRAWGCDRDAQAEGGKREAKGADKKKKGPCLGVAVKTVPLGYIEVRKGKARFVEIVDRTNLMRAGLLLGGLALFLLARLARRQE
jgi:uncharacterized spore protein YtfJ